MLTTALIGMLVAIPDPPVVVVDRDNLQITESCIVRPGPHPVADADGNGVLHIVSDDIVVEFDQGPLRGATDDVAPDTFTGIGVMIRARNVTVKGVAASGYKCGVLAINADGLTIEGGDLSGNFRQRLGSTPEAEDSGDWLWPHANDENEWLTKYGAALCVEDSNQVTIRGLTVRRGQNGIILDHVEDSRIYDNDCSFLSGWGLAMWRSSRNTVTRNAFDFCVRGYSHGVYNRGQDSAGILMFEQCHDNLIAENSATHGGDGLFAFAGQEALGENNPREDRAWYRRRGHTGNVIVNNDFSHAVAHGLELTFSFDNVIAGNQFVGNGICGIWGGYSQGTNIAGNHFEANGDMAYGLERGGVNIEHGRDNTIAFNTFERNKCGIHLWWDDDTALLATPWSQVNRPDASGTLIRDNTFTRDELALQLRHARDTPLANNTFEHVGDRFALEESDVDEVVVTAMVYSPPDYEAFGESRPIGARATLAGREHIIVDEWGPYDWASPRLQLVGDQPDARGGRQLEFRVLGTTHQPTFRFRGPKPRPEPIAYKRSMGDGGIESVQIRVPQTRRTVTPVEFDWKVFGSEWRTEQLMVIDARWEVRHFASPCDPREDVETWRAAGAQVTPRDDVPSIDFRFGGSGPRSLERSDHFGTLATTTLTFPAGRWRLKTVSDDGLRVWLNDELVIDDWTWHAPTRHDYEFALDETTSLDIRIEHFELDGHAELRFDIEAGH